MSQWAKASEAAPPRCYSGFVLILLPESFSLAGFSFAARGLLALPSAAHAASRVQAAPVPAEMLPRAFTVTVNGQPVDVAHAAASYEFVSFRHHRPGRRGDYRRERGFWDRGVDIQPWRLGLRPTRTGPDHPLSGSLARPSFPSRGRATFLNHAQMLFLVCRHAPPPPPTGPNVHVLAAGIHRESLNPKSGDTYLSRARRVHLRQPQPVEG
jgi:hypothetical protein